MLLMFLLFNVLPMILLGRLFNTKSENPSYNWSGSQRSYEWYERQYGMHSPDGTAALRSDYEALGITPEASDDEVKAAYRRMAVKYHPDKVATQGPEVQKAAEEKFKKIQSAYESIKRRRHLS